MGDLAAFLKAGGTGAGGFAGAYGAAYVLPAAEGDQGGAGVSLANAESQESLHVALLALRPDRRDRA